MRNDTISTELLREVEAFLYREARMLEDNRFDDWLKCFTDDVRYWMPIQESTDGSSGSGTESDTFALFDEDKKSLELRVLRIKTGAAHAEVPPSTTQRLITNFLVYQERRGQHGVTFFGKRDDVFKQIQGDFKIAERRVDLAQKILPTTISIFF